MPQTFAIAGVMVRSLPLVLLLAAVVAIWLAGRLARGRAEPVALRVLAFDALLVALLAARAGFVLFHWEAYRDAPWTVLYLWQPGYQPVIGAGVGLAFAIWGVGRLPSASRLAACVSLLGAFATGGAIAGAAAILLTLPAPSGRWEVGDPVDDFRLVDLDGRPVTLSSLAGRPVVLNFWATWCPPCRREMPLLDRAAREHRGHRLAVVGVDLGESAEQVREFVESAGIGYPQWVDAPPGATGFDRSFDLHLKSGASGVPATLFIGRDGRLVSRYIGELGAGELAARVAALLDTVAARTAMPSAGMIARQ